MASFEEKNQEDAALEKAAEDILETLANNLMEQKPKIDVALKNLIAYYLGHQQTQGGRDVSTLMPTVLKVVQTLSKAIQSMDLIPPQQWTASIPQGDESATERLDSIAKYKVIYTMRNKVVGTGNKVTKTFSYDYFSGAKYLWEKLKENVLADLSSSPPAVMEIAEELLELFENSLPTQTHPLQSTAVEKDNVNADWNTTASDQTRELRMRLGLDVSISRGEMKELSELIWAIDFNEALRIRREKRASNISERLRQEQAEKEEQRSDEDNACDGGRVEVIEDDEIGGL